MHYIITWVIMTIMYRDTARIRYMETYYNRDSAHSAYLWLQRHEINHPPYHEWVVDIKFDSVKIKTHK